ncbi:MAG: polysaccharide biosynthesis protein, partial [Desulfobulbaceae bacterium]|nr:polysaccharide biosynthesis protein [Desulfobulbaceae bacterium]
ELVLKGFHYMEGGEIFVPIIQSMRIFDLAKAIAPECKIKTIGIRPGEKLHEALTGEDEGNTISYKGMYVILPNMDWWKQENYEDGKKLPENFVYTSDNNETWLGVEELLRIVSGDELRAFTQKEEIKSVA